MICCKTSAKHKKKNNYTTLKLIKNFNILQRATAVNPYVHQDFNPDFDFKLHFNPHANQHKNRVRAQNIPVPQVRRLYHTLARENAEVLNVLLTRDMPVLSRAMQQTIERLDVLITI